MLNSFKLSDTMGFGTMSEVLVLVLLVISTTQAAVTRNPEECEYKYDKQTYKRTSVLTIRGLPTNLVFHPADNELYFTLIDLDSLQDTETQTRMEQYVLKDNMPIMIDNVNGQAAAVDAKNDKVYISSDDGLYLLNETNKANFLSFKDEDIVQLFKPDHADDLYAVFYPNNEVYKIDPKKNEKKHISKVPCALMLAVDYKENIYFECESKYVKVLLKGFQEPIEYVGIPKNSAKAMTVNAKNQVILATNDGLYRLKPDSMIPKKMMDLDFMPSGVAFNGEDIYISTNGIIYKYTNDDCPSKQ